VLFHTLDFFIFLPLVFFLYWGVPRRYRLAVLAGASVLFYASWSVAWLPLLLGITALAWGGGLAVARHPTRARTAALISALLVPLLLCKYWNWIAENIEFVGSLAGSDAAIPRVALALPVGISFFTFQALAYVIDISRAARKGEDAEPTRSALRFGTFLTFFPQLVAGPIVRRSELLPQLRALPLLTRDRIGGGIFRILRGLGKKVLIADVLAVAMVDPVFSEPDRFTSLEVLVALYAYTLQIYCDFSGYTDIAIGTARLFGIDLPENFRQPYKATCVAGFWRRWHITLSNWVRDYIYYPLGGSQVASPWRVYFNIWLTLLIIGLWHGASWNFVVYGTLHGLAVGVCRWRRKRTGRRPEDPLPSTGAWVWRWLGTFHFIVLARVLFRAPDLPTAGSILLSLTDVTLLIPRFAPLAWFVLLVGYALHFLPASLSDRLEQGFCQLGPAPWALSAASLGAACLTFGGGASLAFVYYQF